MSRLWTVGRWVLAALVLLLLVPVVWLVRINIWPQGSDETLLASDDTPIEAIVVCTDAGEVLWRIHAMDGRSAQPRSIPYGMLRSGFTQDVPNEGPPRRFRPEERLQFHVLGAKRRMGALGKALGPREFLTQVWSDGPRDGVECLVRETH